VDLPTSLPVDLPTSLPVDLPTSLPVDLPTSLPAALPTSLPAALPTSLPAALPTKIPTVKIPRAMRRGLRNTDNADPVLGPEILHSTPEDADILQSNNHVPGSFSSAPPGIPDLHPNPGFKPFSPYESISPYETDYEILDLDRDDSDLENYDQSIPSPNDPVALNSANDDKPAVRYFVSHYLMQC